MKHEKTIIQKAIGTECPYCGCKMRGGWTRPTRDHLIPKSKGRDLKDGNRIICCFRCNTDKADMMLDEFIAALEVRDDPRVPRLKILRDDPVRMWGLVSVYGRT